jgi:uncharacterized UPF0160 family protein
MTNQDNKIVVVHSGGFHADDVFGVAVLMIMLEGKVTVVRSREEKDFARADYVLDVGGVYDSSLNRFDHHQKGGAGMRANGAPYASFGLVWKQFGASLCAGSEAVASAVDTNFVQAIDIGDNGVGEIKPFFGTGVFPNTISGMVSVANPTWKEGIRNRDAMFLDTVKIAEKILRRVIATEQDNSEGMKCAFEEYVRSADKRIITLTQDYPWEAVYAKLPEPIYVIEPSEDKWKIKTVRDNTFSYKNRKDLPLSWAGKSGMELEKVTGIPGAEYCHNMRFIAVAKTREAAESLAMEALRLA